MADQVPFPSPPTPVTAPRAVARIACAVALAAVLWACGSTADRSATSKPGTSPGGQPAGSAAPAAAPMTGPMAAPNTAGGPLVGGITSSGPGTSGTDGAAFRLHVPILMYHLIGGADDPRALPALIVPVAAFRAQLAALRAAGWQSIDLADLAADLDAGRMPPPRSFVITVDDGHEDGFTNALPVLRSLADTATFFVITGRIGRGGYLSAAQLRALTAAGMTIGNHTVDHVDIAVQSPARAAAEIDRAQRTLRAILGRAPVVFAYPSGEASPAVEADVAAAGLELAVGTQPGALEDLANRFLVPRIRVSPSMTPARLLGEVEARAAGQLPS